MRAVGVLEAKTSFSTLIADVERTGEPVTVTRHGRPAVKIVPAADMAPPTSYEEQRAKRLAVLASRDARPVISDWEDLSWDVLKRIGRDEDRND